MSNTLLKYINNRGIGSGIVDASNFDNTIPDNTQMNTSSEIIVNGSVFTKKNKDSDFYDKSGVPLDAVRFRKAGGLVGAYYYGLWCTAGTSYDQNPWHWLAHYPERQPLVSVPYSWKWKWDFTKTYVGTTSNTTVTSVDGGVQFVDTTTDGMYFTPEIKRPRLVAPQRIASGITNSLGTTTTLNDSTKSWTTNQFYNQYLTFTSGSNCSIISNVTKYSDGSIKITTPSAHGFSTGMTVRVFDVNGVPRANGVYQVSIIDSTSFVLSGSSFSGAYVGGGVVSVRRQINSTTSAGVITVGTAFPNVIGASDKYIIEQDIVDTGVKGSDYGLVRLRIKKIQGTTWEGIIRFITVDDQTWNETKKMIVPEPTWTGDFVELTFNMNTNATWNSSNILKLRFDAFAEVNATYVIKDIEVVPTDPATIYRNSLVSGLPSDQQWAVDWEIHQAYQNGIDYFVHNMYWNKSGYSWKNSNLSDYNIQLHANSTAEPNMKFALQWSNHDSNPFSTKADWYELVDYWYSFFSNSRYLRDKNNKPLIYIFSTSNLITYATSLYGSSGSSAAKLMIDDANARIMAKSNSTAPNGISFIAQGACDHPYWNGDNTTTGGTWNGIYKQSGFMGLTAYNKFSCYTGQIINNSGGSVVSSYPDYDNLTPETLDYAYTKSASWAVLNGALPHFPPIIAGWDKKPWIWYNNQNYGYDIGSLPNAWNTHFNSITFKNHCENQLKVAVKQIDKFLQNNFVPMVNIYAWNEFGEGGWICPTKGEGSFKLEVIRTAFGADYRQ